MAAAGRRPGEIRSLRGFLTEHAEALEADLLSVYGVDLRDLWRGLLSYRRLWVLIKHLPADSWTQTALRDASSSGLEDLVKPELEPTFGPWSLTNYQLAALRDEVASVRYAVVRTTPGGEDYPPPPPTPMPGQRPKRVQSDANIRYLNKLRAIG